MLRVSLAGDHGCRAEVEPDLEGIHRVEQWLMPLLATLTPPHNALRGMPPLPPSLSLGSDAYGNQQPTIASWRFTAGHLPLTGTHSDEDPCPSEPVRNLLLHHLTTATHDTAAIASSR